MVRVFAAAVTNTGDFLTYGGHTHRHSSCQRSRKQHTPATMPQHATSRIISLPVVRHHHHQRDKLASWPLCHWGNGNRQGKGNVDKAINTIRRAAAQHPEHHDERHTNTHRDTRHAATKPLPPKGGHGALEQKRFRPGIIIRLCIPIPGESKNAKNRNSCTKVVVCKVFLLGWSYIITHSTPSR